MADRFRFILAAVILTPAVLVGGYLFWVWNHALVTEAQIVVIEPGMTLRSFARELRGRKLAPDSFSLVWLAYMRGEERRLKAGEYEMPAGASMRQFLDQVVAGRVIKYPLVLIEGWTFERYLEAMKGLPKLERRLENLSPEKIMDHLGLPGKHPEGWFYPDTYYYTAGTTDIMLLQRAYENLRNRLQREWENRALELPLRNMHEALILASIVEKETGRGDERKMIAAVFMNRLRRNMRLQSDPTVIYGMGKRFDGNLRLADLRRDTPYNTYTRRGLPPAPIAMPGGDSLHAVLHPADTPALYFVSRGDGSHEFSETLDEHNEAVNKYQRRRRTRSGDAGTAPR